MLKNFPLPLCISDNADLDLIEKVKDHLKELSLQRYAQNLLNVFTPSLDNIESFSIECIHEYEGQSFIFSTLTFKEINGNNNNEKTLLSMLLRKINQEEGEALLNDVSDKLISRETIEKVVAKALGEEYYQNWQDTKKAIEESAQLENNIKSSTKSSNIKKM